MTGRYPCITKCPNCKKDVKFFLGSINSNGKKCPDCGVKLVLRAHPPPFGSDNDELIEEETRLIHEYEKQYIVSDGLSIVEKLDVCPHGLWRDQ